MNNLMKTFIVGTLLAVSAPFAHADSINAVVTASGTNDVTFTNTTITLPQPDPVTGQAFGASISGTINGYTFVQSGLYFNPNTLTFEPGGSLTTPLLIASFGGNMLGAGFNYFITSETPTYTSVGGVQTLTITGTGYFSSYGLDDTPSTFILQASYVPGQGSTTSFNTSANTVAPTPEPSSLLLLGSGLVGTAGMLIRRRRVIA